MTTWRRTYPRGSNIIKDLPELHSDNFTIIEDAAELEHYSMASANATSGEHRPGAVGAVFEGTTSQINAISASAPAGSMAYDTTLGVFKYMAAGGSWTELGYPTGWSRMRASISTDTPVTAAASADTLLFDTEDYDTQGEYNNATGIFTASATAWYFLTAKACFVASGDQTVSGTTYPAADALYTAWTASGAANRWDTIEEASPEDTDAIYTTTSGASEGVSGAAAIGTDIPTGSIGIAISVDWRAKRVGCVCDNTCYGQSCTCDTTCYGYTCTCNNTCYGYSPCTCNNTCHQDYKTCACFNLCYGYSACSCNYTCYGQACTCNAAGYGYGTGCSCNATCHGETENRVNSWLYIGSSRYDGPTTELEADWTNYTDIWAENPSTGLDWTVAGVSAISAYGLRSHDASADTHAVTAWVSQAHLHSTWSPLRPTGKLHIYKNNALAETSSVPFYESAASGTYVNVGINSLMYLTSGDTIDIRYQKTLLDDTISGGSPNTSLSIHRMGGNNLG